MTGAINATGSAAPVVPVTGAAAPAQASGPTLLPTPAASTNIGDALSMLLKMSSEMDSEQTKAGQAEARVAQERRKAAIEAHKKALEQAAEAQRKAREAQEHHGGLFSFVTDNIGATGLVGLATFNWGLVAADVTAHRTGLSNQSTNLMDVGAAVFGGPLAYLAEQELKNVVPGGQMAVAAAFLGGPMGYALERAAAKMSPVDFEKGLDDVTTIKDDDVRLANKIALTVAMAAVAATATVLSGGTTAPAIVGLMGIGVSAGTEVAAETGALQAAFGEKAAAYIALGGAITGAALTLGGSIWSATGSISAAKNAIEVEEHGRKAEETLRATVATVNGAKTAAEGAFTTVEGINDLKAADYQYDADKANADAEQQLHIMKRMEMVIDGIIEDLKNAKDSAQRSTEILQNTAQTYNQTLLQAASIKV